MDLFSNLALGFGIALSPLTLMLAVFGCFLGTIIGALPGLGPSNGVAILIPLTFSLGLDATAALVLMTSVYYGAMYGGRISSILLNIPGDEPAMMTTLDGYPMAKNGRAGDALVISGVASFVGAFLATLGLMLVAPLLARIAFKFGPAEYFALYMLAFATLGGMASNNQAKAAIASCIGLGIAMIGVDNNSGLPRFTGGNLHLFDGVDFLVAIVGLFAMSEVFVFIETHGKTSSIGVTLGKVTVPWKDLWETRWTMLRSSAVGFVAGVLPGAGASLGSFMTYMMEKSIAGEKGGFGTGVAKGVAAPEAGNNAAAGGALVPMLTLGVPGSGTTAVLLPLLMTLNITPGPTLFTDRPDVVWGLIASLLIANFVLLAMNVPMVKVFVKILMVPPAMLLAGGDDDLLRRHLFAVGQLFRPGADDRLRRHGLCLSQDGHPDRAGHPRHPPRRSDGEQSAPRDDAVGGRMDLSLLLADRLRPLGRRAPRFLRADLPEAVPEETATGRGLR